MLSGYVLRRWLRASPTFRRSAVAAAKTRETPGESEPSGVQATIRKTGESLGNFVGDLTPANGVRKLEEHNTAKALTDWLVDRANSAQIAEAVCGLIPAILDALEHEDFRGFFDHPLMPQLLEPDTSRKAGKVLAL